MQIFGLEKNSFVVYEFLKTQLEDSFIFKENRELYEAYKYKIIKAKNEIIDIEQFSYRTFTNAIDSLEKNSVVIQEKRGKTNKEHTGLIEKTKKYEAKIINVDLNTKEVSLESLCKNKHSLSIKCDEDNELLYFPIGEKLVFIGSFLRFDNESIILKNVSNLRVLRRWFQ